MIGQTRGHYQILEKIGAGGMGEVYRARDVKLGRDVAIKVLPESVANDAHRLARFTREAQLLASLNHPNVGAIYGLEEDGAACCLVLELVPGETLAERLSRGPLPIDDGLRICHQIAEALEAAHEKGIVHRDLKPANVKVTPDDKVKVLDFGLAKVFEPERSSFELSQSPTITAADGHVGVVVGTAAYMSPEQARGKAVNKQTDIWAFGCVLYELLTRQCAFPGATIFETVAAVLGSEPDWQALPPATPPKIRDLLRRCLEKDTSRRLHDIADARIEIDEVLAQPSTLFPPGIPPQPPGPRKRRLFLAFVAVLALAAAAGLWNIIRPSAPATQPMVSFLLPLADSPGQSSGFLPIAAWSSDGARLVYVVNKGGRSQLVRRRIEHTEASVIAGTEGAYGPFFSPDGSWVGFFAGGKLKRVRFDGGTPIVVCDASVGRGASWAPDDTIVFAPTNRSGLWRVSAAGGTPKAITSLLPNKGERSHRHPEILPGGEAVLFTIERTGALFDEAQIAVCSLKTGERRTLIERGSNPHYAPAGHLLYARSEDMMAAPFDLKKLKVTGSPVVVLEGVAQNSVTGLVEFALSRSGSIAYVPVATWLPDGTLVWVDRNGSARPVTGTQRPYHGPRFSPAGDRLALTVAEGFNRDIWIYDIDRDAMTRLTFEPSLEGYPAWTPDGQRVVFDSSRNGARNLFWMPVDGSAPAQQLTTSGNTQLAGSWAPDGSLLVFEESDPSTNWDVWALPMTGSDHRIPGKPYPLLQTPFYEGEPRLSPDGHWLAYVSDESGRPEVYVKPFPGLGGKAQISNQGGTQPIWAHSSRELFYRQGDQMLAVNVTTSPNFKAEKPRLLFAAQYDMGPGSGNYDVSPDGQKFVMVKGSDPILGPAQLNVVLNWFGELQRKTAAAQQ